MSEPDPNLPVNLPTSNKQPPRNFVSSKVLFLIIFLTLLAVIAAIVLYFFVFTKKDTKKPSDTSTKIATSSSKKEEKFDVGYVTALEGLNLRSEPSTESDIILLLPAGTELKITGEDGDWYMVEAQTKGFVAKEFVSKDKPAGTILKLFDQEGSPFKFLYPSVYKVTFTKNEASYEYSFSGNDSYGGFKVETQTGLVTLGNYSLKNYPESTKSACDVQVAASRKECEKLATSNGTLYLVLIDTTLYKISYLKTEGGLLTDINNLVFFSMYFE